MSQFLWNFYVITYNILFYYIEIYLKWDNLSNNKTVWLQSVDAVWCKVDGKSRRIWRTRLRQGSAVARCTFSEDACRGVVKRSRKSEDLPRDCAQCATVGYIFHKKWDNTFSFTPPYFAPQNSGDKQRISDDIPSEQPFRFTIEPETPFDIEFSHPQRRARNAFRNEIQQAADTDCRTIWQFIQIPVYPLLLLGNAERYQKNIDLWFSDFRKYLFLTFFFTNSL